VVVATFGGASKCGKMEWSGVECKREGALEQGGQITRTDQVFLYSFLGAFVIFMTREGYPEPHNNAKI